MVGQSNVSLIKVWDMADSSILELFLAHKLAKVKKRNGDEMLTAKAYNGRVICSWLNHALLEALDLHPNHEILNLTSAALNLGHVWWSFHGPTHPVRLTLFLSQPSILPIELAVSLRYNWRLNTGRCPRPLPTPLCHAL